MTRKLTEKECADVEKIFGDLSFEQKRRQLLSRSELRDIRHRNNVDRPSRYGYIIDDLTTLAAVLFAEQDKRQEELNEIMQQLLQIEQKLGR